LEGLGAIGWIAQIGIEVKDREFEIGRVAAVFVVGFEPQMGATVKKRKKAISSCGVIEGAFAQTLED
jgi:hypothetical protein